MGTHATQLLAHYSSRDAPTRGRIGIYNQDTAEAWNDQHPGTGSLTYQYVPTNDPATVTIDLSGFETGFYGALLLLENGYVRAGQACFNIGFNFSGCSGPPPPLPPLVPPPPLPHLPPPLSPPSPPLLPPQPPHARRLCVWPDQ